MRILKFLVYWGVAAAAVWTPLGAQTAPVFSTAPGDITPVAVFEYSYLDTVTATDADAGDTVTYSLIGAPPSMAVGSGSGIISWTPLPGDTGAHTIRVRASDPGGLADTLAFTVTVDSGRYLWFENFEDDTAQGITYSGGNWQVMGGSGIHYLAQLDFSPFYDHSALYGTGFPGNIEVRARIRLESKGAVALVVGAHIASDSGYRIELSTADSAFSCFAPDGSLLVSVRVVLPLYRWYGVRVTVNGGVMEAALDDTVRFARVLPVPAAGRAGVISGKDVRSQYDDLAALTPLPLPYRAPQFVTTADSLPDTAFASDPFTFTLAAVDSNAGDMLTFGTVPGTPGSLVVHPVTGAGYWLVDTADTGGTVLRLTVTDRVGLADTLRIPVYAAVRSVVSGNHPPEFVTDPDSLELFVHVDSLYRDTVLAADPDSGDIIRYTAVASAPAGFAVDPLTGAIRWQPGLNDTGFIDLAVVAGDSAGAADTLAFTVFVLARRPGWCRCSQDAPDLAWYRTYNGGVAGSGVAGAVRGTGFILSQYFDAGTARNTVRGITGNGDSLWVYRPDVPSVPAHAYALFDAGDGTYVIAGDTGSVPSVNGALFRTDSLGAPVWERYYGNDVYTAVTAGTGTFLTVAGHRASGFLYDALLAGITTGGDTAWTHAYGGADDDAFTAIAPAGSGWLAAGYTYSYGAGNADLWLVRTGADGDTLWTRTYGGPENERAAAVMAAPDSGWLVAGWTEAGGTADAWLLRISPSGDTLWTHTFGTGADDRIMAGAVVGADGYILAGRTRTGGNEDGWLLRVTLYGDTLWSCTAGGADADRFTHALPLAGGGFLVSGATASFAGGPAAAAWALRFRPQPPSLFPTDVTLVLDSVAGAAAVLADEVTLYYTVNDSAGRTYRVGDFQYSVGDSFSWTRAGFDAVMENGYLPAGSRRAVWNSQASLPRSFADPLYVKFCVADSAGDSVWTPADSIPDARADMAMALVGDRMYLVGGLMAGARYSDRLDVYDPVTDSWRTRMPLPVPLKQPAAAELGGKLYVLGGMNNNSASARVFVYDPRIDRWSETAPLPTPRFGLNAAAAGGKLFAFGGFNVNSDYQDVMEAYDPVTGTWETRTPLPGARYNPGAGTDGDVVYVFGGYNAFDGGMFTDVLAYTPATDTWDTAGVMRTPRHSAGVAMVNGEFVLAGGYSKTAGFLDVVEAFSPVSGRWRVLDPLPEPRMGPGAASLAGHLFIFGGMGSIADRLRSVVQVAVSVYSNYVTAGPFVLNNIHDPVVFTTTSADLADTVWEDSQYTQTLAAVSPVDGSQTRFEVLPPTPAGLSVNPLNGTITWLPLQDDVGTHVAVYRAYDRRQVFADTLHQLITVLNVNDVPVLDSISLSADTLLETATTRLTAFASDEDGDSLAFVWTRAAGGDTLGTAPAYAFTPSKDDAGLHLFVCTVSDPAGASAAGTVAVFVRDFALPSVFSFTGVVPHPFAGHGSITLHLAPEHEPTLDNYDELADDEMDVRLVVYSAYGRVVRTLLDGTAHPGKYRLPFDGRGDDGKPLPAGGYLLRLETERFKRTVKLLIVR